MKTKSTHGGARRGAGRPATVFVAKKILFGATVETLQILSTQENKSAFINEAITNYNELRRAKS